MVSKNAIFLVLFLILLLPLPISAKKHQASEEQPIEDKSKKKPGWLEELLDMKLPKTQRMGELEISINPRLDDIVRRDYIRLPLHMKYGITPNWELSFRLNDFLVNPFRGEDRSGISDVSFGTKYQWKKYPIPYVDTATDFSVQIPTDNKAYISDRYTHYRPQIIFSKIFPQWNEVQLSFAINLDILSSYSENVEDPNGTSRYDALGLVFGVLYPAPSHSYSLEAHWVTTEIDGGNQNTVYLLPGFFWFIPKKKYLKFPGTMRFGLGLRIGINDTEDDFAFIARLNWDLPIKKQVKKYLEEKRSGSQDESL